MNSFDIIKLHKFMLENFNIKNIPLCTIDAIRNSSYWENFDKLFENISLNVCDLIKIINEKYSGEDDALKSYAIIKFALTK